MSKFLKALEQAERDRTRSVADQRPVESPSGPATAAREGATGGALGDAETPTFPGPPSPFLERRSPSASSAHIERAKAPDAIIEGIDPHLVSLIAPEASDAEQYRSLRSALEVWRQDRRSCVIGISSPA